MRVGSCVDQLRTNANAICGALHTSLDQTGDAEFIRDLTQVSLRAGLVSHHRCSADDFQVRDFCQMIKDFVLYTISEKRVFWIGAQILKWQYGDARFAFSPLRLTPAP